MFRVGLVLILGLSSSALFASDDGSCKRQYKHLTGAVHHFENLRVHAGSGPEADYLFRRDVDETDKKKTNLVSNIVPVAGALYLADVGLKEANVHAEISFPLIRSQPSQAWHEVRVEIPKPANGGTPVDTFVELLINMPTSAVEAERQAEEVRTGLQVEVLSRFVVYMAKTPEDETTLEAVIRDVEGFREALVGIETSGMSDFVKVHVPKWFKVLEDSMEDVEGNEEQRRNRLIIGMLQVQIEYENLTHPRPTLPE